MNNTQIHLQNISCFFEFYYQATISQDFDSWQEKNKDEITTRNVAINMWLPLQTLNEINGIASHGGHHFSIPPP